VKEIGVSVVGCRVSLPTRGPNVNSRPPPHGREPRPRASLPPEPRPNHSPSFRRQGCYTGTLSDEDVLLYTLICLVGGRGQGPVGPPLTPA